VITRLGKCLIIIEATKIILEMFDSSPHDKIHYVLDITELETLPNDIYDIVKASRPFGNHTELGWLVAYGSQNRALRLAGKLVSDILRKRVQIFDLQQEAYDFLTNLNPDFEQYLTIK